MVCQENRISAELGRHLSECGIAPDPRPRFHALSSRRLSSQTSRMESNRQTLCRPSLTLRRTMRQPCIRLRTEAVVHMQTVNPQSKALRMKFLRGSRAGMQQGCGVATAAVGHRDAGHVRRQAERLAKRRISGFWCR